MGSPEIQSQYSILIDFNNRKLGKFLLNTFRGCADSIKGTAVSLRIESEQPDNPSFHSLTGDYEVKIQTQEFGSGLSLARDSNANLWNVTVSNTILNMSAKAIPDVNTRAELLKLSSPLNLSEGLIGVRANLEIPSGWATLQP